MFRLVYISTARHPIDERQREQILAVSRRNNLADGLTGLLVIGRRRFLQCLEGERSSVMCAFNRISADPRHYACVVLASGEVAARQFPHWAMGQVSADEGRDGADIGEVAASMIASLSDKVLRAQFTGFIEVQLATRAA